MSKLLSSNFSRLWKNKIFWLCMGGMLVYAVVYMLSAGQKTFSSLTGEVYTLEHYYFQFLLYVGFFFAVVSSMFLGTDYSDGTMRNKLIVGHTRTNVYLANLIVTFVAGLLIMCVWFIGALVGVPALGFFTFTPVNLVGYFVFCILLVAAYSAINTFIAMLSSNKTTTVLISLALAFGLLLCASMIYNALEASETINTMSGITISGTAAPAGEAVPNPSYIGGAMRSVFQMLLNVLPTGQSVNVAFLKVEQPYIMILSSVVVTVGITALGIVLFRKKDLK